MALTTKDMPRIPIPAEAKNLEPRKPTVEDFPPGMVAIPCNDLARYHLFTHNLTTLDLPHGSYISMHRSSSVVQNMNSMIKALDDGFEWVWIVGDDHTFDRDIVLKLLAHDVDIAVPLCVLRGPPFWLTAYDKEVELDKLGRPQFHVMGFEDLPEHGLVEVAAAGSAGMLVKRRVFDAMEEPWFENSDNITTNEDVTFCRKARKLGFKVMLDVDSRIGHIGVVCSWPDRRRDPSGDTIWGLTLDFQGAGDNNIFIPGGVRSGDKGAPHVASGALDWE